MITGLEKAIENFILPKFPWIEGYKTYRPFDKTRKAVVVEYYPKVDEDGMFTVTEEFQEVENITKAVFDMLNDGDHFLYKVDFYKP